MEGYITRIEACKLLGITDRTMKENKGINNCPHAYHPCRFGSKGGPSYFKLNEVKLLNQFLDYLKITLKPPQAKNRVGKNIPLLVVEYNAKLNKVERCMELIVENEWADREFEDILRELDIQIVLDQESEKAI